MDVFASALAANPMQTRQDAVTALLDLIRPLKAFYSAGGALLKVGASASHTRWGADSNTGQRRSRKWAAGAETKKAGGQYEIIPLRSNVHTLRKSRTYLRMFSFAMIAR